MTSLTPGSCRVCVHRLVDVPEPFELFGISMNRNGSGAMVLRSTAGLGPYEGAIAAWKDSAQWLDKFVEYCNSLPNEDFGECLRIGGVHPYRWWPTSQTVVRNGDVTKFLMILKQIVDHREDLQSKENYGDHLTTAQKKMLRYFESILVPSMKACSCCWMNLIRSFQKNRAGVYDQPYTKKGRERYSVEQQQLLMSPKFLAVTTKVIGHENFTKFNYYKYFSCFSVGHVACAWGVEWPRNSAQKNRQDF